ncbi:MAG: hypothetical protein H0V54_10175 [Chthoniobacterales bacterium]|nr:hypothetical protein [Chthoniobacterales bacterium]
MKIASTLVGIVALVGFAPLKVHGQKKIEIENYCTFGGAKLEEEVWTFTSDDEAVNWIKKIAKYSGLEPNFQIRAANVGNALATIQGEERIILYDQGFMRDMDAKSGTDWASVSILAHEIGHHLQGHTLRHGGSRPNQELEADKFSGFILARMNATLDQAKAAMQTMKSPGSSTHPPSGARVAAIINGWRSAEDLKEEITTAKKESDKPDSPTLQERVTEPINPTQPLAQPTAQDPTPNIVAQVVIYNDNNRYFLTSNGLIMAVTFFNQKPMMYGRQLPSNDARWAWMIQTPRGLYPVDLQGIIVGMNTQNGQLFRLGHVSSM